MKSNHFSQAPRYCESETRPELELTDGGMMVWIGSGVVDETQIIVAMRLQVILVEWISTAWSVRLCCA